MARPNSIAGLRPAGVESVVQAAIGEPSWKGSVFRAPDSGKLKIKLKDITGRWVVRGTGLLDTPENRVKARAALDALRAEIAQHAVAPRRERPKSNARNASFKRRRGHACEVCGWTPRPPLRLSAVNAHHVRPREEGGDDSDENRLVLCPNHHAVAHALYRVRPSVDRAELLARIREWEAGAAPAPLAVAR